MSKEKTVKPEATTTKSNATKPEAAKSVWSKLKFVSDAWDELTKYGQITKDSGLTPSNKKRLDSSSHGVIKFTDGKTIIKVIRVSEGVYDVWGTPGLPEGIVQEIEKSLFA
ncbi:hypothetical protein FACS1894130_02030 [Spirochaetia bacterium]|nr:hypothetical protein FACS1894130_02030 [Spirochaetia bacterium]